MGFNAFWGEYGLHVGAEGQGAPSRSRILYSGKKHPESPGLRRMAGCYRGFADRAEVIGFAPRSHNGGERSSMAGKKKTARGKKRKAAKKSQEMKPLAK